MTKPSRFAAWILTCGLLLFITSCAGVFGSNTPKEDPAAPPPTKYVDFKDVQVPSSLKVSTDNSFVYETGDFRAGVLTFKGRMPVTDI
ncbi:MAG: hypothetical protein HQK55_05040, partial [Deltaproteobacteria bacterium]|nr:hypothetical protein [Deltaproteobacteria bacterium]